MRLAAPLRVLLRLIVGYLLLSLLIWLTQDLLLFPLLQKRLFSGPAQIVPPAHIEQFSVITPDGETLDVWTTHGKNPQLTAPFVGLIFHGNGETVATGNFLPFFARHKIPAFTFDYRGYGKSTGWISEGALLNDAETIWQAIQARTGVPASQAVILGNSIGTGPASWLASRISPKTLILLAGYSDIPEILKDMPIYRPFTWLLRYHLPTARYLQNVTSECVILGHGKRDQVINFRHLELLSNAINQKQVPKRIALSNEEASHDDIYYKVEEALDEALDRCLGID